MIKKRERFIGWKSRRWERDKEKRRKKMSVFFTKDKQELIEGRFCRAEAIFGTVLEIV